MAGFHRSQVLLRLTVLAASVFFLTTVFRVLLQDTFTGGISSTPDSLPSAFISSRSLRLPYRGAVRSADEILSSGWVRQLWSHLAELDTLHVSLCVGDSRYTESVVNWLVSALVAVQPPLDNVLIVSLDAALHEFLQERGLDSLFINPQSILRSDVNLPTNFSHIWATRFVLFRLINHWGYTVATYDSDALLARNPQPLFAELGNSDLVGSSGIYPFNLHREWKSPTLCMGVVVFRPSQRMETFWDHFAVVQQSVDKFDDQVVINTALNSCGIAWSSPERGSCILGVCRDLDLRVSLLPESVVCRRCRKRRGFYVWHQKGARGQEDKRRVAEDGGMWFLKRNLNEKRELKGTEWLRFLYENYSVKCAHALH